MWSWRVFMLPGMGAASLLRDGAQVRTCTLQRSFLAAVSMYRKSSAASSYFTFINHKMNNLFANRGESSTAALLPIGKHYHLSSTHNSQTPGKLRSRQCLTLKPIHCILSAKGLAPSQSRPHFFILISLYVEQV
jgi:hypothetical protein